MTEINTVLPVVSGTPEPGKTLLTDNGSWTYDLDYLTYTYRWLRCDAAGANCVAIAGATAQAYQVVAADIGSTLRSEVTATEHSPAFSGQLTWTPPGYPSYSGYTTVNIPNTGVTPTYGQQAWVITLPAGQDFILNLDHRHETASGYAGLSIHGGRNIVVIGGEIEIGLSTSVQGDGQRDALTFIDQTGTVHVEGVLFSGNPLRAFVTRAPGATFQFQNCRGGIRMGWNGSFNNTDHSDVVLDQETPNEERFDLCTFEYDNTGFAFYANGGTRKIKRTNLRNRPDNPTGHDYIHRNVTATRMEIDDFYTETGFGFNASGGPSGAQFTLTDAWLFAQPAMALTGNGKSQGSFVTFTDPSGDNVSGNGIKYGSPPTGDYCPVGVAGTGYTSPGYV